MVRAMRRRFLARSLAGALALLACCSRSAQDGRANAGSASPGPVGPELAPAAAEPDAARLALEDRYGRLPPEDLVRARFELEERVRAGDPGDAGVDQGALDLELEVLAAGIRDRQGLELEARPAVTGPRGGEPEWRSRYVRADAEDLEVVAWRLGLWLADDLRHAFDARLTSGPVTRELSDTFFEA
jgi:hypothetical protein